MCAAECLRGAQEHEEMCQYIHVLGRNGVCICHQPPIYLQFLFSLMHSSAVSVTAAGHLEATICCISTSADIKGPG